MSDDDDATVIIQGLKAKLVKPSGLKRWHVFALCVACFLAGLAL